MDFNDVNVRNTALYLGVQVEALTTKLVVSGVLGALIDDTLEDALNKLEHDLKQGVYDGVLAQALLDGQGPEILDANLRLVWVSVTAAYNLGVDASGVYEAMERRRRDPDPRQLDLFTHPATPQPNGATQC